MTSYVDLQIATPRLLLRPLAAPDAPVLFRIFSDPRVMRYWSTPPWTSPAQAEALIERALRELAAGEHIRLGVVRTADQRLLGTCSLFNFAPQSRRAEVGYGLAPEAWGQGYTQEAVGALLHYGFATLDLHRVEADIDPRNEASARSLGRLGFVKEGHLRERWIVDGEVSDSALYGLLRSDWEARSRSGGNGA
jgi:RimJ/RimL family protein N-acetyltransferase